MSKTSPTKVVLMAALMTICFQSFLSAETSHTSLNEFGTEAARLATYENAAGETSFALSLSPQIDEHRQLASDIVIYVDTSASQTGVFKKDSISTLRQMLANLNADDRVKLVAIDVDPVDLTDRFVAVDSDEIIVAIEKLQQRVSLGSTDMSIMTSHASRQFNGGFSRNRNAVYIGDGVSRVGFLDTYRFRNAVTNLVKSRIAFSSFAIGPQRDIEMLAALSNNTGGNIFIDTDDPKSMADGAKGLASTVHGMVFWPTKTEYSKTVQEIFPASVPPMRLDRDSIVIGTLSELGDVTFTVQGEINGETKTMNWPVTADAPSPDFSFLPKLVEMARKNNGITLPTIGSAGLREMARVVSAGSIELTKLGSQALATGNLNAASTLAKAALKTDPMNGDAEALAEAARRAQQQDDDPFGSDDQPAENAEDPFGSDDEPKQDEPVADDLPAANDKTEEVDAGAEVPSADPLPNQLQPGQVMPPQDKGVADDGALRLVDPGAPAASDDEVDRLLQLGAEPADDIIGREVDLQRVKEERLKAQVRYELQRAREEMATTPGEAIERMKSMIDILDQVTDIGDSLRVDLRNRLESALMTSRRRKLEFDESVAMAERNEATASEIRSYLLDYERREQEIGTLVNRFSSLMYEGNYQAAEDVAVRAFEIDPFNPLSIAADEGARIAVNERKIANLRRIREINFLATLYETEKSAVPFSGAPPLVFPDKETWLRKKALRAKWQDVRLAGNPTDERILSQLDEQWSPDYDETPFIEVMDELQEEFGINVVLDQSARDDSLNEDDPITFKVTGIRMKNALRLLLKEHNATFIVRDEVMRIISLDVASDPEYFVTNVYNVGDLVAPRFNPGGGGGGGFGGGGQGGGGFGGGGQGGGGFGGGQGGGAGGGGVFCIEDKVQSATPSEQHAKKRQPIPTPPGDSPSVAWSDYFEKNHPAPSRVRATLRQLMQDKQPEQIVGLVQGAIENNQAEPWMYEAMVLAMQIARQPRSEIERALLSAVDLSGDEQDALIVAEYMSRNGMEKRAIGLVQELVDENGNQPEPYVIGLNAAKKINDIQGIQWACVGILSQAWPDHRHVITQAFRAAEAVRLQLKKEGRLDELTAFNQQLDKSLYRDSIVKVSWTGDADIDLYVEEPGGTICSRLNPRTTAGGVMLGDVYSKSENESGEMAEYYVLPKGFTGDYRVLIRRVWGQVAAGKVTVSIYNHFRTDQEASQQKQIELDQENGSIVQFHLANGRRQKPLSDQAVETVAQEQFVMNRRILAQKMAEGYSPTAASDYYGSQPGSNEDGIGGSIIQETPDGRFVRRPTSAGYQPVVTQYPDGSFLFVNHATTADRLYVLVSASPFFSNITEVTTFNIAGNAANAQGGGGALGGGGGGGALGGGGGALGGGGGGGGGGGALGGGLF